MKKSKLILLPVLAMSLGMLVGCDGQAINNAISGVQSQIDGMQSDINDLKNQVKDLKEQIAKLEGEMNANIAQVTADYKKEIAELEADISSLQKKIDDLTAQLATDKDALETDYNSKINIVKTDYDAELVALKNNYDKQLADLEKDYKDKIDDLKEEYDANLATITANYDAQLEALVANYDSQLQNIRNDYNGKLDNIQTTYNTKVAEIEANIASANANITALQSELALQIAIVQKDYNDKINELTGRVATLEEKQTHNVSFDSKGAGEIASQVIVHGEKARKPEDPVREGAVFKGWNYHDESWYFYSSVVTEDMQLVANWELINYRVTFKNDDGTVLDIIENVHYGDTVAYSGETPVKPNQEEHYSYSFKGWDKDLVVLGDMELIAQYDKEYLPFEERYLDAKGNLLFNRFVTEEEMGSTLVYFNGSQVDSIDGKVYLEAEDGIFTEGVYIAENGEYHGGKIVEGFNNGIELSLDFTSTPALKTNLCMYIARENGLGRKIKEYFDVYVNNQKLELSDDLKFEKSNGWLDFELIDFGKVDFANGGNNIRVVSIEPVNIDYFTIDTNTLDLEKYGVDIPTKANEGNLMFNFNSWDEKSNENNVITYQPVFEEATIGLEFNKNKIDVYHGSSEDIVIPAYWNGCVINEIGHDSFAMTDIQSVQLPDTIVCISSGAFAQCQKLETINFPNSLKRIEGPAFQDCFKLVDITLNEGLTFLGNHAFDRAGIKYLTFPSTLETICDHAFAGLDADFIYVRKEIINIQENAFASWDSTINIVYCEREFRPSTYNPAWAANSYVVWGYESTVEKDGYKYAIATVNNHQKAFLVDYDSSKTEFVIPETINDVPIEGMFVRFKGNKLLKNIVLPDFVTSISNEMFKECNALQTITLSKNLKSIGIDAFMKCTKLTSVTFPEGLETISRYAFSDCEKLGDIILPDSITEIEQNAFSNCDSMRSITFPKSLEVIESGMCENSNNLVNVVLPEDVKTIKGYAFFNCSSYVRPILRKSIETIEAEAFGYDWGIEMTFYEGTQEQFENIEIGFNGNDCILNKPIYYYSETEPATPGNFWRYVEGVPTVW